MTAGKPPRKAELHRWRREIVGHLEEFPRQYAALEHAMAAFGEDFDLKAFKEAFETPDDMEAYNRVQALERAVGRVQNFVAELATAGVKLAGLPARAKVDDASLAQQAFEALRDAGVIDRSLCRQLIRAQRARSAIEHGYLKTNAGDVHRAAELIHDSSIAFIARFRPWVARHLTDAGAESSG